MQHTQVAQLSVLILWMLSACTLIPLRDTTNPTIRDRRASIKVLAKSDCIPTWLTITAQIKDAIRVDQATLWYRVGAEMNHADQDQYTATVIALDIPGGEYGVVEFYILGRDEAGNETKSPVDGSVQLLPCIAS